jgi:alpha-beta hydrolase superfamily lysophospholipase
MASAEQKSAAHSPRNSVQAEDDRQILIEQWQPTTRPIAVIQILHGLGEHATRYERFANACVAAGIAVAAHNHRGHGRRCPPDQLGHFADAEGWNKVVDDAWLVRQQILSSHPGLPVVLLGHSMGSYIAQYAMMRNSQGIFAMVLSASTYASRTKLRAARMLAKIESGRSGGRAKSELLDRLGFGSFNKRFAPNRTSYDWLSRDEHEVDKYVADPACGGPFSNQLWCDLTGGLLEISSRSALRKISPGMPILIFGGAQDPVGGQAGLTSLAQQYRQTGHDDLTLRIYAGGRHEMLNETNREEVTRDIIEWIRSRL